MITKYLEIKGYWGVLLCFDFDERDAYDMAAYMESFGLSDWKIDEALDVLLDNYNTGMTISSFSTRMSLMFISDADSVEQWCDTLAHEIDHVQDAICEYYGVPLGSERAAWLQGYIARMATRKLLSHFM